MLIKIFTNSILKYIKQIILHDQARISPEDNKCNKIYQLKDNNPIVILIDVEEPLPKSNLPLL